MRHHCKLSRSEEREGMLAYRCSALKQNSQIPSCEKFKEVERNNKNLCLSASSKGSLAGPASCQHLVQSFRFLRLEPILSKLQKRPDRPALCDFGNGNKTAEILFKFQTSFLNQNGAACSNPDFGRKLGHIEFGVVVSDNLAQLQEMSQQPNQKKKNKKSLTCVSNS